MAELPPFNPNLSTREDYDKLVAKREAQPAENDAAQEAKLTELERQGGIRAPHLVKSDGESQLPPAEQAAADETESPAADQSAESDDSVAA